MLCCYTSSMIVDSKSSASPDPSSSHSSKFGYGSLIAVYANLYIKGEDRLK